MTTIHPILGSIDGAAPGFWTGVVSFATRAVVLELTIDGVGVSEAKLSELLRVAEDVAGLDRLARQAIERDVQAGEDSAATLYLSHHWEELPEADLQRLFGTTDRGRASVKSLLAQLVLSRIGLYPESEERRYTLDYSLGFDVTQSLLCVALDSEGQPSAVDFES